MAQNKVASEVRRGKRNVWHPSDFDLAFAFKLLVRQDCGQHVNWFMVVVEAAILAEFDVYH